MPRNKRSTPPPKVMTWARAAPILVLCVVFDGLRLFFDGFVFFGPAMAAVLCTALAAGTLSKYTAGLLGIKTAGLACAAGATAGGVLGSEFIEPVGIIMAMAVGLIGWLTVFTLQLVTNRDVFDKNHKTFVRYATSLLVSEAPLINAVPALTVNNFLMIRTQIKKDLAARRRWEAAEHARVAQEAAAQQEEIAQFQAQQAANDDADAEEAADESDELVRQEASRQRLYGGAANDDAGSYAQNLKKAA